MVLKKVLGKENPADLMTKGLSIIDIEKLLGLMNSKFREHIKASSKLIILNLLV